MKIRKSNLIVALTFLLQAIGVNPAFAQFTPMATAPPGTVQAQGGVAYQGRLEEAGVPVNGNKNVVFRLFDAATGGASLWDSGTLPVLFTGGFFGVALNIPTSALAGAGAKYLEIEVEGVILTPRDTLSAVPYAKVAESIEGTVEISSGGFSVTNAAGTILYISSTTGQVGIGTSAPAAGAALQIIGGDVVIGTPTILAPSGSEDLFVEGNLEVEGALSFQGGATPLLAVATGYVLSNQFFRVGADSFSVTTNGRVGLSTGAPAATLDIIAATNPGIYLEHATNPSMELRNTALSNRLVIEHTGAEGRIGTETAQNFVLRTGGADRLTIDTSGDVGIGIVPGGFRLNVGGSANVTGSLTLGTALAVSEGGTGSGSGVGPGDAQRANLNAAARDGSDVTANSLWAIRISSTAAEASRLEIDGANCTVPGEFPKGIDQFGNAQACTDVATELNETGVEGLIYDADGSNNPAGGWTVTPGADINFDNNTFVVDVSANRVGISSTTPGAALGVEGDVSVTGVLRIGSGLTVESGGTGAADIINARANLVVPRRDGLDAFGTWPISISGTAADCTTAVTCTLANDLINNQVGAGELRDSECVDGQIFKRGALVANQWGCGSDNNTPALEPTVEGYIFDTNNTPPGGWTVNPVGDIKFDSVANTFVVDVSADRVGIGTALPTAALHLKAGTTGVGGAALKFNPGAKLTLPEAGAVEWDGTDLFITQTGLSRKTLEYVGHAHSILSQGAAGISNFSYDGTGAATVGLANTTVAPGSYGDASNVGTFTVDAQGRITAAANTAVTGTSPVGAVLNGGQLWVGSAGNLAAAVAMSGDGSLSNAGVLTIGADRITPAKIQQGTAGQLLMSNAVPNTAWTTMGGDATITSAGVLTIGNDTVTASKIQQGTAGQLLMSNATPDTAWTTMSGDATLSGAGALSIGADAITPAKIQQGAAGQLLMSNGVPNTAWTTMGGDATITSAGVLTIGNDMVTAAKIQQGTAGQILMSNGAPDTTWTTMSGDATLSGTGALTLASVVAAGTYRSVTVNAKGLVTAGTSPTTFAGYVISDTSVNLDTAITDDTGSGALVFASGPTFAGNVRFPGSGIWETGGSVGIGTTSPGAKLDVAGSILASGNNTGNVPHACTFRTTAPGAPGPLTHNCNAGEIVVGGGGVCAAGNIVQSNRTAAAIWTFDCGAANNITSIDIVCCAL